MITLPRRSTFAPIAGDLPATSNFQLDFENLTKAIEDALNGLADQEALVAEQVQQIQQAQAQLQAVQQVANNASATSGGGSGNRASASSSLRVTSTTWTTAVSVSFTGAVAASSVALGTTGPAGGTADHNPKVTTEQDGQVQLLENGTLVAGPIDYSIDSDGNLVFAGFSDLGSDATTGSITYDLQIKKVSGANAGLALYLDVTRNP